MAGVRVRAPTGELGEVPEENLQAALQSGFQLDEGEAVPAPSEAAPEPVMVRMRAPSGEVGMIPAANAAAALDQGFVDLAKDERYGTAGQQVATAAEGLARGATLGASDTVQSVGANIGTRLGNWLADAAGMGAPRAAERGVGAPLMDDVDLAAERDKQALQAQEEAYADIQGRRETNQALAATTEVVGALAPAALSGGVGSVGALARMTPAGQLANLATKMGTTLTARAGGAMGRVGALALTGAAEGAVDAATRRVMDDLAAGNVELTAERALEAAWDGAKFGGLTAGGIGLAAEGLSAAARGGAAIAQRVSERVGSLGEQAGKAAFRALGRADNRALNAAGRAGGEAAVGETLLRRGVVRAGDTAEDIAERVTPALDDSGKRLGAMIDEIGDATTNRRAIWNDIEEKVVKKYDEPGSADIAEGIRAKLRSSGIEAALNADGEIGLRELHQIRKAIDTRPDLKWLHAVPGPVDPATEMLRDVRRVVEDSFEHGSDAAAKARGVEDFLPRLKAEKREYQHLAIANQLADREALRNARNNRLGLNDVLAGVAGVNTMGPAGALAAVGSRMVRDRGEAILASTLYKLARGAVKQEQAVDGAVEATVRSITRPAAVAVPLATKGVVPAATIERMVAQARALQDPESPESHQLEAMTLQMAAESPDFADAMRGAVRRKADFIVRTLGPQTDPNDPSMTARVNADPVTAGRRQRFMVAAADPSAAMQRLASGAGSAEDLAVVRELTPQIHKAWVDRVLQQIQSGQIKPTLAQRQRLQASLGVPVYREQTPEYVRFYQQMLGGKKQEQQQAPGGLPQARQPKFDPREFKVDNRGANRADALVSGVADG